MSEPAKLMRYSHSVGRNNAKFHLVKPGATTAACGKPVIDFNTTLADGYDDWACESGVVCARCERAFTPTSSEEITNE